MPTHHFIPQAYYSTIGSHEPVLHIAPGDRVITTTIDASGRDEFDQEVSGGGNPMTGPFYIDGAQPGDTLIVRFERIRPNRSSGWTEHELAPHVVDAHTVRSLYQHPQDLPGVAFWDFDFEEATAVLREETMLGRLALPLAPFLGCFGVAPAKKQAIHTSTSGPYGGNMDYRGFGVGVTAYLPVFEPGALFFLGDGHAVQGDGEIAGTGIETSMEVEFSVDLIPQQRINWPRGENEREIFTAGNARPLDQALQHATGEMIRWLETGYGLDSHSIALFLGQTVQYEIGNVYDPAFTVVCKLSKKLLALLPKKPV